MVGVETILNCDENSLTKGVAVWVVKLFLRSSVNTHDPVVRFLVEFKSSELGRIEEPQATLYSQAKRRKRT